MALQESPKTFRNDRGETTVEISAFSTELEEFDLGHAAFGHVLDQQIRAAPWQQCTQALLPCPGIVSHPMGAGSTPGMGALKQCHFSRALGMVSLYHQW